MLLCHGFGSYDDDLGAFPRLAELLAQAGVASFRFSFSGSDPYPDQGTIRPASQWVTDCLAAFLASAVSRESTRAGWALGRQRGRRRSHPSGGTLPARPLRGGPGAGGRRRGLAPLPLAGHPLGSRLGRVRRRGGSGQRSAVMGRPSRRVPHFDVQALPDEGGWNG